MKYTTAIEFLPWYASMSNCFIRNRLEGVVFMYQQCQVECQHRLPLDRTHTRSVRCIITPMLLPWILLYNWSGCELQLRLLRGRVGDSTTLVNPSDESAGRGCCFFRMRWHSWAIALLRWANQIESINSPNSIFKEIEIKSFFIYFDSLKIQWKHQLFSKLFSQTSTFYFWGVFSQK